MQKMNKNTFGFFFLILSCTAASCADTPKFGPFGEWACRLSGYHTTKITLNGIAESESQGLPPTESHFRIRVEEANYNNNEFTPEMLAELGGEYRIHMSGGRTIGYIFGTHNGEKNIGVLAIGVPRYDGTSWDNKNKFLRRFEAAFKTTGYESLILTKDVGDIWAFSLVQSNVETKRSIQEREKTAPGYRYFPGAEIVSVSGQCSMER
jgi:hypothetical protein